MTNLLIITITLTTTHEKIIYLNAIIFSLLSSSLIAQHCLYFDGGDAATIVSADLLGATSEHVVMPGKVNIRDVLNLTPMSDAPSSPGNGDLYVDTDNHIYCYLNGVWKQLDN